MDKDELIDIWREVVLKNTTNGSCNFQQAAIDFAELVAKPWVETNKALANEIIELQKQAEQEPVAYMVKSEGFIYSLVNRISAAEEIVSMLRKDDQGAAIHPLYAAPVRTKDLTDEEILSIPYLGTGELKTSMVNFARAVIAADREKNK